MTFLDRTKQTLNVIGGSYADDMGKKMAQQFLDEAGIIPEAGGAKSIFSKEGRQLAKENIGKMGKNFRNTSLGTSPISTIKNAYSEVNSTEFKEAAKVAKEAAKTAKKSKGIMASCCKFIGKKLKGAGEILGKIPVINKLAKLTKVPAIGTVLIAICELPEVFMAFGNGSSEGIKQIGRSAINILGQGAAFAGGTVAGSCIGGLAGGALGGAATGAAAGSVVPVVGNIIGAIAGLAIGIGLSMAAGKVTESAGDGIFGKAKHEIAAEAAEAAVANNETLVPEISNTAQTDVAKLQSNEEFEAMTKRFEDNLYPDAIPFTGGLGSSYNSGLSYNPSFGSGLGFGSSNGYGFNQNPFSYNNWNSTGYYYG